MMKSSKAVVAVVIGLALVAYFFADDFLLFQKSESPVIVFAPYRDAGDELGLTDSGNVETRDIVLGEGDMVKNNSNVVVKYKGWTEDGGQLLSGPNGNIPLAFTLGRGEVISGWDSGLVGMKEGGVRRLVVPSEFGYGKDGLKDQFGSTLVPPNTALIFEIFMLSVSN